MLIVAILLIVLGGDKAIDPRMRQQRNLRGSIA